MDAVGPLVIVLVCLVLSAFFSGSETALLRMGSHEAEPAQLVESVLHQGAKMVLGGPSKARKSWSLIDLMLSVSTGAKSGLTVALSCRFVDGRQNTSAPVFALPSCSRKSWVADTYG